MPSMSSPAPAARRWVTSSTSPTPRSATSARRWPAPRWPPPCPSSATRSARTPPSPRPSRRWRTMSNAPTGRLPCRLRQRAARCLGDPGTRHRFQGQARRHQDGDERHRGGAGARPAMPRPRTWPGWCSPPAPSSTRRSRSASTSTARSMTAASTASTAPRHSPRTSRCRTSGPISSRPSSPSPARRWWRSPQASNGLVIERKYFTPDGQPVDPAKVKQNTRLVAVLSVMKLAGESETGNFLLVDRLPAGFEIENPTLVASGGTADMPWLSDTSYASYTEFRDDRFVASFTTPPPSSPTWSAPSRRAPTCSRAPPSRTCTARNSTPARRRAR